MFKKKILSLAISSSIFLAPIGISFADALTQVGQAEVSIKANKDLITARAAARKQAEFDAIRAALKLKLNVDAKGPKAEEAIAEMLKTLAPNLKTTYMTEGDALTARATLTVDSAELTDLARSLDLQNGNVMVNRPGYRGGQLV